MKSYAVEAVREGKFWMVSIPELDGLTQARTFSEIPTMAKEWIELTTETTDFAIHMQVGSVEGTTVDHALDQIKAAKRRPRRRKLRRPHSLPPSPACCRGSVSPCGRSPPSWVSVTSGYSSSSTTRSRIECLILVQRRTTGHEQEQESDGSAAPPSA